LILFLVGGGVHFIQINPVIFICPTIIRLRSEKRSLDGFFVTSKSYEVDDVSYQKRVDFQDV